MASKKVRGSYAGTLAKKIDKNGKYKLSKEMLHKYGQHLVDYIKIEAKKDMARRGCLILHDFGILSTTGLKGRAL